MTRRLRLSLLGLIASLLLLPTIPAEAATSPKNPCATTSMLTLHRRFSPDTKMKLKFCVNSKTLDLEGLGRDFSMHARAALRIEYVIKDRKRQVVHSEGRSFGSSGSDAWNSAFRGWSRVPLGAFELPDLPAGRYTVEVRMIADWVDDGKGPVRTPYKRLSFNR